MIAIADPQFRDELERYAIQTKLLAAKTNAVMA
jgi:acyl-CoA hydrolase